MLKHLVLFFLIMALGLLLVAAVQGQGPYPPGYCGYPIYNEIEYFFTPKDLFIFNAGRSAEPRPRQAERSQERATKPTHADTIDGDLPAPSGPVVKAQAPAGQVAWALADCKSCHGGGTKRGGVSLFNAAGHFQLKGATPAAVLDAIESGSMPPAGRPRLSAAKKGVVKLWASGGGTP